MSDESSEAMNRAGLLRAWPIAVATLLSFCLALGLTRDFAWLIWLAILALLTFAAVRVFREAARNGSIRTGGHGSGSA